MTITTILCDLDGTLVDSRTDIAVAFQHAWRTVIDDTPPTVSAIGQHIGKPLAEMVCELGGVCSSSMAGAFLTAYRRAYAQQGRYHEAIGLFQKARTLGGNLASVLGALGQTFALVGDAEAARRVLREIAALARERHVNATSFALVHLGLGENEKALDWLERGCAGRDRGQGPSAKAFTSAEEADIGVAGRDVRIPGVDDQGNAEGMEGLAGQLGAGGRGRRRQGSA